MQFIPLFALLLLLSISIWEKGQTIQDSKTLQIELEVVKQIGLLLDELHLEQELALEYATSRKETIKRIFSQQITKTKEKANQLISLAKKSRFAEHLQYSKDPLKYALVELEKNHLKRQSILQHRIEKNDVFQLYKRLEHYFIDALNDIHADHIVSKLSLSFPQSYLNSYINLILLKQFAREEKFIFGEAFASNNVTITQKNQLISLVSQQQNIERNLLHSANSDIYQRYKNIQENPSVKLQKEKVEVVLQTNFVGGFGVNANDWHQSLAKKLDYLQGLEQKILQLLQAEPVHLRQILDTIQSIAMLTQSLQSERNAASLLLTSQSLLGKDELSQQTLRTDQNIQQLVAQVSNIDKSIETLIMNHLKPLQIELQQLRIQVNNRTISVLDSILGYAQINSQLIELIASNMDTTHGSSCFKCLVTFYTLVNMIENASLEQTLLTNAFTIEHFTKGIKHHFIESVTKQTIFQNLFQINASPEVSEYYEQIISQPIFAEVESMRNIAINSEMVGGFKVNIYGWSELADIKSNLLKQLSNYTAQKLITTNMEYSEQIKRSIFYATLFYFFIISLIISTYIIIGNQLFKGIEQLNLLDKKFLSLINNREVTSELNTQNQDEIETLVLIFSRYLEHLDSIFAEDKKILEEIHKAAKKIKQKDFSHNIQFRTQNDSLDQTRVLLNSIIENFGLVYRQLQNEIEKNKEKDMLLLEQSKQSAIGEMIGNIAHQWRQPLNALGLTIQKLGLLAERGQLQKDKIEYTINHSMMLIQQMSNTINDFRDFFKPNKAAQCFSVNETIKQAQKLVEASIKYHNIHMTFIAEEEIYITNHKNELAQVIINLLANAKDAIIEKQISDGFITISMTQQKNHVNISILDNAGGIADNIIKRIFEPYFTTKDEGKGTGIGLYMSRTIIENHMNGNISVKNMDSGACFSIQLPLNTVT